jgi:hypothetical protein
MTTIWRCAMTAGVAVVCAALLTGAGAAAATGMRATGAPATDTRAGGLGVRWGRAEPVPGLAALTKTGSADVTALTCWSVNNCAAGGYYNAVFLGGSNTLSKAQAFVVIERHGRWNTAVQVPGLAARNTGGIAEVTSVSCAARGYCVAGGYYTDAGGNRQGFVVSAINFRWQTATGVPGLATLNTSGGAQVSKVSCPQSDECAAAGSYTSSSGGQGFIVNHLDHIRRPANTAQEVPGLAALSTSGSAGVGALSCWDTGKCAAGGSYDSGNQAFAVTELNGVWGTAEEVPGTGALNTDNRGGVASISCARDGYCAIAGSYTSDGHVSHGRGHPKVFLATGSNGDWGTAVPLTDRRFPVLGAGGVPTQVTGPVSCPSAGNCAAGLTVPDYGDHGQTQAFVVSQKNGVWAAIATIHPGFGEYVFTSLSCPSAGNCGAGAYQPGGAAYVASETNGRWTRWELVPADPALSKRLRGLSAVSCPAAGHCTAGGGYADGAHREAYVTAP